MLIEDWLPVAELGIESRRERAAASALPPLYFLHVWWARRPLVASAAAVLGSLMPSWSPTLAQHMPGQEQLTTEDAYRNWFLRLCGILGDAVAARKAYDAAVDSGVRIPNPYSYPQAYKNIPTADDLAVLHELLRMTWGVVPTILDPTAGGGSIPLEALRYGLPVVANDLNSVAAAILRAGVELPALYGRGLTPELRKWGTLLTTRIRQRLEPFFPSGPDGTVATYVFARTVLCPRTGKTVPLAPNWWLLTGKAQVAVRLKAERHGRVLPQAEFDIVNGSLIDFDPDKGTVSRGRAISPWDGLAIDDEYIRAEARSGRLGSQLYAVAVRNGKHRTFRPPTSTDLEALGLAEEQLTRLAPEWLPARILPTESIPVQNPKYDVARWGMRLWTDMFSPRQLLVHGVFVEEFQRIEQEVRSSLDPERGEATLALLALMQGKGLNYNSVMSVWHPTRGTIANTFDRHDFSFKWTHGEFEGARELYAWCLEQIIAAYDGIAGLLDATDGTLLETPSRTPTVGGVTITARNAADLADLADGSMTAVCIDPPYYDNVMYAELADFFYVWEKRTLGRVWPELFREDLCDKKNEAVASPARFADAGRRRHELANADYEAKMTAIFAECHRVLADSGVMTVMFTHKKAEAWDTLGMALMEAGFAIQASWPVNTESEQSLHQAKKNAATSTIFLVCRKRSVQDGEHAFFEDVEADVRRAARAATIRFAGAGISGVDLLLSTYGPALSVISSQWPVYSSEADSTGKARLLRPEHALDAAREEVVRIQRRRLIGADVHLDPLTDFALIAWDNFRAAEFPFDEARRLALATGGLDVDELSRARIIDKKAGTVVLLAPAKRVRRSGDPHPGVRPEATAFECALDAVHTIMYVADTDGMASARALLDRAGLTTDGRFLACLQGLVNAIPRTRLKGMWVRSEAETLDRICVAYFPDITIPEDPVESEVLTLF